MKKFSKSSKLEGVSYDVRGPVLEEADRMQEEGISILKLNTGNPAPFGFEAPNEIVRDLIMNVRESEGYSDSKGIFSARKAIEQYYQLQKFPDVTIGQRLCFAMQIVTDTPYMLMDEVMNGLDPTNVELISNVLKALREQKKAIVIASHILTNLDSYADRVLFLKDGKIIHEYLGRKSLVNEPLYVKTDSADFLVAFPELTTVTIDLQGRIYLVEISDPQLPQRFIAAGITDFSVGHLALNELYLKYFPENS